MEFHLESALRSIVEMTLPRWSDSHLGLHISLDASYSYFGDKHRKAEYRREIRLLFQRPMNYTKVFVQIWKRGDDIRSKEWKLACDHDSCWSTDGLRICNEVEQEAMNFFRKKEIPWLEVHQYTSFGIVGPRLVLLKSRKPLGEVDPNEGRYHRDWEIEMGRQIDRREMMCHPADRGHLEGVLIKPEVLEAEKIDKDEMF